MSAQKVLYAIGSLLIVGFGLYSAGKFVNVSELSIPSLPSFTSAPASTPVASSPSLGLTPAQQRLLSLCTGLELTEEPVTNELAAIAVSNCIGRIRGLADGHTMTAHLVAAKLQNAPDVRLWCIEEQVSDKQLLDTVVSWVEQNPARVKEIIGKFTDTNAATSMIVTALNHSYPCKD